MSTRNRLKRIIKQSKTRYKYHKTFKKRKRKLKSKHNMSTTFTYTADENGDRVEESGPAKMPAYVARRLNGSKKRFKKKGTPAEREAAVEAEERRLLAVQGAGLGRQLSLHRQ